MKRIIQVIDREGVTRERLMTAQQAAFLLRMAELKARTHPGITFEDMVVNWREKPILKQASEN